MKTRRSLFATFCVAALAAAAVWAGHSGAQETEGEGAAGGAVEREIERVVVGAEGGEAGEVQKIVIRKRVGDCEGDECEGKRVIRKVFVDEHGERHEVHGGGHEWVEAHAGGPRGFLGVGLTELTPELRAHFGAPEGAGVMVAKVVAGSPAEQAGVAVGDIIAAVGDAKVVSAGALARKIGMAEAGRSVALEVWRDGRQLTLSPTIEVREASGHSVGHVAGLSPGMKLRKVRIECGDGEDCGPALAGEIGYDCGDVETCEVRVECGDAGCDCTANGESIDCSEIPGFEAESR